MFSQPPKHHAEPIAAKPPTSQVLLKETGELDKPVFVLPSLEKGPEHALPTPHTVQGSLFINVSDYEKVLLAARAMIRGLNKGYDDLQNVESSNKTKKAQFTRLHNILNEIQESLMIVDARLFESSSKVIS